MNPIARAPRRIQSAARSSRRLSSGDESPLPLSTGARSGPGAGPDSPPVPVKVPGVDPLSLTGRAFHSRWTMATPARDGACRLPSVLAGEEKELDNPGKVKMRIDLMFRSLGLAVGVRPLRLTGPTPIVALGVHLALALAVLLPGCQLIGHPDVGVSFFTEPPGARVIVDKKDSGFVTPCRMALESDKHHVEFAMSGYKTANVTLVGVTRSAIVYWRDMTIRAENWCFPMWLNLNDTVEPFKFRKALAPGHVYVRLQRSSEP
jgi:hypothetical protein